MANATVTTNTDEVIRRFESLNSRQMRNVHRSALRQSLGIMKVQAVRNIRTSNLGKNRAQRLRKTTNGRQRLISAQKELSEGVKVSVSNESDSAKVHIMGHPLLRIFERGNFITPNRPTKNSYWTDLGHVKRGAQRGNVNGYFFFKRAFEATKDRVANDLETRIIVQVHRQFSRSRR